jgi:hypothetical protein
MKVVNSGSGTSQNMVQAFAKMKHLEAWELQLQLKIIDKDERKFRDLNERQKLAFMHNIKERRRDWWKFDLRIRDALCKEFDNHILNRTKHTVMNQYIKPGYSDSQIINEVSM